MKKDPTDPTSHSGYGGVNRSAEARGVSQAVTT